jgi:lysophospholipase L1-like esterase
MRIVRNICRWWGGLISLLGCMQVFAGEVDLLVYGGTPAGVAAAVSAARQGREVILIEPQYFVGGMMAGGLAKTDIGDRSTLGGVSKEFFAKVRDYYVKTYGEDSEQVKLSKDGAFFEPKVAAAIFRSMLDAEGVNVLLKHDLVSVSVEGRTLKSVRVVNSETHQPVTHSAKVFIDASYEGDLLAGAGVPYRVGREARAEFNESLAGMTEGPEAYLGTGDHRPQAYNMRSTLTNRPDILVPIPKPEHYDPKPHRGFIDSVKRSGYKTFEELFHDVSLWSGVNGKFDPNKADAVGLNFAYAEADPQARKRIVQRVRDHWLSLWYMLQHDPELPESFRNSAKKWGLPKDEFVESGHVSPQVYVRVARRMLGRYFLTQNDVMDDRFKDDSICLGSYNIDSHEIQRILTDKGMKQEGFIIEKIDPYEIPYRSITAHGPENLLVSCAVSASHIAYGTLRMEPVFMMIGQASGEAAHLSLKHGTSVQGIPVPELQKRMSEVGVALKAPFRPKVGIKVTTPPPYRPGQQIHFEAEILRSRGEVNQFQWNFDGTGEVQGTDKEGTFIFPVSKTWKVSLMATDTNGFKALPEALALRVGEGGTEDIEVSFPAAKVTGRWNRAATSLVGYRFRTPYHDMADGKGEKAAVFETRLPEDGIYRIAVAYPHDSNRAPEVPVTIESADGIATVKLNQRRKASDFAFAPLGEFRFVKSQPARVTISNKGTTGFVTADAFRWIRVGPVSGTGETPANDQPNALPRVLLIGDSISMGYEPSVRKILDGKANVERIDGNGGSTKRGLVKLDEWLGEKKWDLIHFNFGLHDLKLPPEGVGHTTPETYEKNLRELVARLKSTGATLVWATTTPVPDGGIIAPDRRFGDVAAYNQIAAKVMKENGVEINDLNALVTPHLEKYLRPKDVHYNQDGSDLLAKQVARTIEANLKKTK